MGSIDLAIRRVGPQNTLSFRARVLLTRQFSYEESMRPGIKYLEITLLITGLLEVSTMLGLLVDAVVRLDGSVYYVQRMPCPYSKQPLVDL